MVQYSTQNILQKFLFILALSCFSIVGNAQNVAINSTGAAPNASALLDLAASNKGFLVPRVALSVTTSNSPIGASVATSLLVYNTATVSDVTPGFYYWDSSKWVRFTTGASTDAWEILGNSNTTSGTNFIGTTNSQALDVRTNNVIHVRITTKGQIEVLNTGMSVFVGEGAGANDDLTNNENVFVGFKSGNANVSGIFNSALGYQSLLNNTGSANTALGTFSLSANTSGGLNTAAGVQSLGQNTTGTQNASFGNEALSQNLIGDGNTAMGYRALKANKGDNNVGIGREAGENITTGSENTYLGNLSKPTSGTFVNSTGIGNSSSVTASNQVRLGNTNITSLYCQGAYSATTTSASNVYVSATGQIMRSTASAGGSGWSLTGDAGTTPTTNFIGTTDAQDFVTKTNNTERMRVLSTGEIEVGGNTNSGKAFHIRGPGSSEKIVIEDIGGTASYLYMAIRNKTGAGNMSYGFSQQGGNSHFAGLDLDPDNEQLILRNNYHTSNGFDNGVITFVTRNAGGSGERMRVDNDGNVGIGATTVRSKLHVAGGVSLGNTGNGISATHGAKNSIQLNTDTYYGGVHDEHSGALIYAANMNGWTTAKLDICISNNWGTYNTASPALRIAQAGLTMHGVAITSDRRLKTNIEKLNYGLKDLMKITPVSYEKHIAKEIKKGKVVLEEKGEKRIGFIAQDLYQIIPEVVNKPKNEDEEFWSVDYSKMSAVMVKAIQELNKKIETLEKELAQMKDSQESGN